MAKLPSVTRTPNDADFDYEIEGLVAVYNSENSAEVARACQFGIASREILTEEFLFKLRDLTRGDTGLEVDIGILIGLLQKVETQETSNANQTKLPL